VRAIARPRPEPRESRLCRSAQRLLRDGDEFGRKNETVAGMLPSQQRFHRDDRLGARFDPRLEVQLQHVAAKRAPQIG
jgi:hypothetical protein